MCSTYPSSTLGIAFSHGTFHEPFSSDSPSSNFSRISAFFSSASLAGAFTGLLATALMNLQGKGGHPAWAWIFIVEGLFTVGFGLLSFFILPRSPAHVRFLNAREKDYVIAQLRQGGAIGKDEQADSFSWIEVLRTFKLPQVWLLCCVYFLNGIP